MREARLDRVEHWQQMLHDDGYDLSLEPLAAARRELGTRRPPALREPAGRSRARALVRGGVRSRLGGRALPGAAREGWDVFDAMAKVPGAGGVTVFAHPYARLRGAVVGEPEIRQLAAAGLTGIEVDHPDHAPDDRAALRRLAARTRSRRHRQQRLPRLPQGAGLGAETTAPAAAGPAAGGRSPGR